MTAKEIAQLIESPESLSAADFAEIEKLASKYPYAQTFPLLLLQHLGKTKAFDFDEQLNKYAYKITDRAQLYFLINEGAQNEPEVVSEPIIATEIEETEVEMTIVPTEPEVVETPAEEIIEEEIVEDPIEVPETKPEIEAIRQEEEVEIPEETVYVPMDGIRTALDINPDEDMSDFRVVEVQEMTFDPVTIDFDDDEIKALDFDDLIDTTPLVEEETIVAEEIETPEEETVNEAEEIVIESVPELPEEIIEKPIIESVEELIPVETIAEEIVEESTPELPEEIIEEPVIESVEAEIPVETTPEEIVEEAQIEAIAPENIAEELEEIKLKETSNEQESIQADELVESIVEIQTEEIIKETPAVVETEEDENIVHHSEMKPMEFFDPTADLFATEKEKEFEEVQTSAFEEESQAISFEEEIIPSADIEMDEFTSNAIAAGYQLTADEEVEKPEPKEEKQTNEVVQEFEDKIAADKRSFTDWLKVSATTNSAEYQVKPQRTVEIMDRFIKDDPKITRISKTEVPEKKVAEFFKVSTIAKESLNEQVMPVSETLALIYEQQANFTKAIDAYEQLMLLFPEKKSFFANQIKKLKQKIKN